MKKLNDEKASLIISLVYLLNPYIHDNPFETLTLFMGFIIYTFYFYEVKNYKAFFLLFIISLSTMEFNPVIGGFLGIYILLLFLYDKNKDNLTEFIKDKNIRKLISPLKNIIKSKYFYFSLSIIIISLSFYEIDKYMILYFSSGTHKINKNLINSGNLTFIGILNSFKVDFSSKINSILTLNAPFLFLSFMDPIGFILEFPWFFASGITSFGAYWSPYVYYDSYTLPFAAIAMIFGIKRLSSIIKDEYSRKKVLRYISILALFITIILLISNSLFPMIINPVTPVNNNKQGVDQLAPLIPHNQSVYTGVNELPIVSQYAPNTWFYGNPENYTLFNISKGAPYSLSGYNFIAASGNYELYSRTSDNMKFNNLYTTNNLGKFSEGRPLSTSNNYCLPPGSYNISWNENYLSPLSIQEFNKGNTSKEFLNDSYAMIYPIKVNSTLKLNKISINSNMYYGYYIIQSMITSSLNPKSVLQGYSYGHNQYNFINEILNYNLTLKPGKTYYLWLWSSGYPGGMYYPVHKGNNVSYVAKIYNGTGTDAYGIKINKVYSITKSNLNPQIYLYGDSKFNKKNPSNIIISINSNSNNETHYITINKSNVYSYNFIVNKTEKVKINLNSNILNGTLSSNLFIKSNTYKNYNNFFLKNPNIVLGILFILTLPILLFSFFNVSLFANMNFNKINNLSKLILIASLILYFVLLTLYFYLFNIDFIVFKILGIVISILLLLFIISYRKL